MATDAALSALTEAFYADLHQIARHERFRAGAGATLRTTALIHEAWIKLQRTTHWDNQRQFLATAALAMRQVLANDAEARRAAKRNYGQQTRSLERGDELAMDDADFELLRVSAAVERLARFSSRLAQVVECRYFAGYSEAETALALDVTERTVRRDWVKARAWLFRELGDGQDLARQVPDDAEASGSGRSGCAPRR